MSVQSRRTHYVNVSVVVPRWSSYRNAFAGWSFFATTCLYLLRINFSVVIVCMTYDDEDNVTETGNATDAGYIGSVREGVYGSPYKDYDEYCPTNSSAGEQVSEIFSYSVLKTQTV